jgi:hypothetical protein
MRMTTRARLPPSRMLSCSGKFEREALRGGVICVWFQACGMLLNGRELVMTDLRAGAAVVVFVYAVYL